MQRDAIDTAHAAERRLSEPGNPRRLRILAGAGGPRFGRTVNEALSAAVAKVRRRVASRSAGGAV